MFIAGSGYSDNVMWVIESNIKRGITTTNKKSYTQLT